MVNPIRTVVLACAKQHRADLGAVVEVLAGRGNAVEIVTGVESNPLPWEQAVGRIGPNAIYVVCGDDTLTLEKIAGLRATLQRGNVPLKHIWAGPINWAEPVQVLRHADQLLRAANGQIMQPPSEASGRTVLAPPPPPQHRTAPPPIAAMTQPSAPAPNPTPTPTIGSAADSMEVEGMSNRRPLLFVGVGVALTGVIATALLWPDDEPEATVAAATTTAKEKAPAKSDAAKAAAVVEKKKAAKEPVEDASPAPDEPEAKIEQPEQPAAPDEPEAVAVAAEAVVDESAAVVDPPLLEDPAVAEALRNQSIRALDILLISPEAKVKKRRSWKVARHRHAEAAIYCERLAVDGVESWRLPSIGELASLTTANILARGTTYWSDTKGDTYGNTRVIWAVRVRRMISVGANNRGARTICVRDAV